MIDLDRIKKLIDSYSQEKYDFNPDKLTYDEIESIKTLAKEKRHEYGIAPIGTNIFKYIRDKEKNIYFEAGNFNSCFDALIYLPDRNSEIAFIILNKSKPLVNQIFAAAHEYYHYIRDIDEIKKEPIICSLADSRAKREQKASRFAAEFLLPEEALRNEVRRVNSTFKSDFNDTNFVSVLCYILSINYGLPLKAVIYRLYEEGYIKDLKTYEDNYDFMKKSLSEIYRRLKTQCRELLSPGNNYIDEIMYDYIPKAYQKGYVSYDKLQSDVDLLQLNIEDFNIDSPYDNANENDDDYEEIEPGLVEKLRSRLYNNK